jgi:hypothetical protein
MKGCIVFVLFIILLFFGPIGWFFAVILGIVLLTSNKKK